MEAATQCDTRAGHDLCMREWVGVCVATEVATDVGGLMASLPSPSQLLRDLDSCNSDPVAVASCFVERVRRTSSLLLVPCF